MTKVGDRMPNFSSMPVTILAMGISIVVFFVLLSKKNEYNNHIHKYTLIPMQVKRGQYYRILTSAFMHIQPYHILMNMIALYNIGSFLEPFMGSLYFGIVLCLSILGSGIAVTYLSGETSQTIGLSGGIFGLLGAYIMILFKLGLFGDPSVQSYLIRVVVMNGLISLMPGVSWQGHLGGALTGLILTFFLF